MKRIMAVVIIMFACASVVHAQEAKSETAKNKTAKEYIADLSSTNESIVIQAAQWLGKEKESDAVPKLKELLTQDNRNKVRLHSAMALGYIGEESSIDALNGRLLNEPVADVRYTILLAITRVGISKKEHVEVLKKARDNESDIFIKDYLDKMWERFKKSAE
ncbi:MAG TPA: HEAT repeat domain-containing protein [Spirochaetota bacterium]|nr:HEAT repeat domain-containing protein [Spirochaetota bacterium]HPJ39603.1 HEAT repeat domain-containing protein [Spirochaetota bacterium]HPQ53275.1 HEAT repeat domain-containing protein [Spirochaetota bacterium]